MGWDPCQIIQHLLDLDFANALDKCLERFILLTLRHIPTRESLHHFGDSLRRDRAHRQTIGAGVVSPLAAQHNLEVRHGVVPGMTADAIKTKIGNVMLSTGIEAAADLDMQVLHSFIHCVTLFREPLTQFPGQPTRGGNSKLAGIRAGAGGDVDDRARAGLTESDRFRARHTLRAGRLR